MTSTRPRVALVSLHFDPRHAARTLKVVDRLAREFSPVEVALVANQADVAAPLQREAPRWSLVRHDNRGTEFGGYQAGLDHVLARHDFDWLLVLNDTVGNTDNYSPQYHEQFVAALAGRGDVPTVVGRVDAISRSYAMSGMRTHRWVRTNLLALNRSALAKLDGRLYDEAGDGLVRDTDDPKRFFDESLDPVLRDHLETFLFRTRPGWHWYGAASLDAANAPRMARKARSILQEKLLSAKLEHHAADFVNIREMSIPRKALRKWSDIRFGWKSPSR